MEFVLVVVQSYVEMQKLLSPEERVFHRKYSCVIEATTCFVASTFFFCVRVGVLTKSNLLNSFTFTARENAYRTQQLSMLLCVYK